MVGSLAGFKMGFWVMKDLEFLEITTENNGLYLIGLTPPL